MALPTTKIRKKIRYFMVCGSMPEDAWARITRRFLKIGFRKSCWGDGGGEASRNKKAERDDLISDV